MPGASLLQRLKERKLVQWALAYLAGAFVVVQLMDALAEPLGLSAPLQVGILIALLAGFFVALVLAWYHGEKRRHKVSGPELMIVAALLVVAGVVLTFIGSNSRTADDSGVPEVTGAIDDRPKIAVLPLENFSPDSDDDFFAGGVQEDLISKLSRIGSVAVISRSSVEGYRDPVRRPPLQEIAAELGADYVVEGSARISADSARITVQLIDGASDVHVWSESFDAAYSVDEYVRVQAEIVQRIAFELRAALSPEDRDWLAAVPTHSLEALEHFMRGNEWYLRERLGGAIYDWEKFSSIRRYEAALELDPGFSLALANLALAGTQSFSMTPGAVERVERLARRALAIDPEIPAAKLALAIATRTSGDPEGALALLAAAEESAPDYSMIPIYLASWHRMSDDLDLAAAAYRRAERTDPRNPLIQRGLKGIYTYQHRYADALEASAREDALLERPHALNGVYRTFIHLARGDRDRADAQISELVLSGAGGMYYRVSPRSVQRVTERYLPSSVRATAFEQAVATGDYHDSGGRMNIEGYLNSAIHAAASGRDEEARAQWEASLAELERAPLASRRFTLTFRTLAHMGLGDGEAALETAQLLMDEDGTTSCRSSSTPALNCTLLARVHAQFGEPDAAIDLLEEMLPAPSWLTVHTLEVDPAWDPLRDHPRFQALLEEYADDVEH